MQHDIVTSRGGLRLINAIAAAGVHSSLLVGWEHGKMKILFDIGTYERGFDAKEVFISHGHTDHIGSAVIHARAIRAQKTMATYYVPEACVADLEFMRQAQSRMDGEDIPMNIKVLRPGESVFIGPNNNFRVMAFATEHRVESQGYAVYSQNVLAKAKVHPDYAMLSGKELGELKMKGTVITTEKKVEEHLDLVYTGDTTFNGLLNCPTLPCDELFSADIFIVECTYLDGDRGRALKWQHVHVDDLVEQASRFETVSQLIITHISVRYQPWGRVIELLQARLPPEMHSKTAVTLREFGSGGQLTWLQSAYKKARRSRGVPGGAWGKVSAVRARARGSQALSVAHREAQTGHDRDDNATRGKSRRRGGASPMGKVREEGIEGESKNGTVFCTDKG